MEILFMMVSNLLHVLKLLSYWQVETLAEIKQYINASVLFPSGQYKCNFNYGIFAFYESAELQRKKFIFLSFAFL